MVGDKPADTGRTLLVDARGLGESGIGRYLAAVLSRLLQDRRFGQITLVGNPGLLQRFLEEQGPTREARVLAFPYGFYSAPAQLHWLWLAAHGLLRADVAFFPHYDVPTGGAFTRSVVVVQDLTHFKLKGFFPAWKRLVASLILTRAVERAVRVVVSSESTRRDLLDRSTIPPGRLAVIPLGVDRSLQEPYPPGPVSGISIEKLRPYVLCVGNRKPHKNMVAGVETLARLRRTIPDIHLVIAGRKFSDDDAVSARARELGVQDAVVELGEVTDAELRTLYSQAEALLFPSLYEGFGLPILEAMAHGTPVVASNRASIPEVVGDAGIMTDPYDWDGMAAAVLRLRGEPTVREEMILRGRARAASLSWESTARKTADLLWDVASGNL